jgi:hypothetical protein
MFVYCQKSGEFWRVNGLGETAGDPISDTGMYGTLLGVGYSGRNAGRNNPEMQGIHNTGPIPRGPYTIGMAETNPVLGPMAMPLIHEDGNHMCGRGGFWIHGDNATHDASHGCIVVGRDVRQHVAENVVDLNNHLLVME